MFSLSCPAKEGSNTAVLVSTSQGQLTTETDSATSVSKFLIKNVKFITFTMGVSHIHDKIL